MNVRRSLRVVAVVGIFAASTFLGATSRANHAIDFTECADATPGIPEPTLTPPPVEGEPTPEPDPGQTPPPQNCMPAEGERIWGTRTLEFTVDQNSSGDIDKVSLSILSQEQNIPSANQGKPVSPSSWSGEGPFSFDWNSAEATPYNGIYKVVVTAHAEGTLTRGPHDHKAERVNLRVDNPPNPIAPPKVIATTLGSVTLEWQRAPEPDVTAYTIYRATTDSASTRPAYGDFKQVGITEGPAFRDSTVQPGVHWYSVRVTRRSVVTPDVGISSPASQMSGPAEVASPSDPDPKPDGDKDKDDDDPPRRYIPYRAPQTVRPPSVRARPIPDAPFAYKLPYDTDESLPRADFGAVEEGEEGPSDPRGAVLPVAVGMFLVSSALAVGRMPY